MKNPFLPFISVLVLLITCTASAQMGNRGGGMDRNNGRNSFNESPPKKQEKIDYLQVMIDKLEKELTLDSFQKAVIKELVETNHLEMLAISEEAIPDISKLEKMSILKDKLEVKIISFLNPEQQKQFEKMKAKTNKKK